MKRRKTVMKAVFITAGILAATALLSVLQYAIHYVKHPLKREQSIDETGVVLWGDQEGECAEVSVSAEGEDLHYLFRNEWDGVAVKKLAADGHTLLEDEYGIECYVSFPIVQPGGALHNGNDESFWSVLYVRRHMELLICGIKDASVFTDGASAEEARPAVLVAPAKNREEAEKKIKEVLSDGSDMGLRDWLVETAFFGAKAGESP